MGKIRFLFFLFLIFFFSIPRTSFAMSEMAVDQESEATPLIIISETPIIKQSVNYSLPYPGLLPDHPLYPLKAARDRIIGFLISSPLKKAEFNLLQADKRLNAGLFLFNSKKISLAITTISKAENYFHEAIAEIRKAKAQGINITSLTEKLLDASKKHQEVILSLEERSKKNVKESLVSQRERVGDFEKQAARLLSKEAK